MSSRYAVDPRTLKLSEKVLEAWRIPAAIDLFCRAGAKSGAALAAEARRGGWGLTALTAEAGSDGPGALKAARLLASEDGAGVWPLPAALRDNGAMAEIGLMARDGEKLFCVPEGFEDWRRLRALFCYASGLGCRLAVRPCLGELCAFGQINDGDAADRLGMKGVPAVAEAIAVAAVLTLAGEWGVPLHVRGVSCRASLEAIRAARDGGQDVTCDVPFMNLIHTEDEYDAASLEGALKVWPVLRGADDRAALWRALDEGLIAAVVSNHCARSADQLSLPFEEIPFGSEKLNGLLPELLDGWEAQGRPCGIERLLAALGEGPAKVLGRPAAGRTLLVRAASGWRAFYEDE